MRRLAVLALALGYLALFEQDAPAWAYGCYPPPSYGYCQPAYYQPAYYQPSYYQPYYVEREVPRPYAVRAYVGPDYFYSVQDYYRDKLLVDAIAGRLGAGPSQQTLQALQMLRNPNAPVNYGGYAYYGVTPGQALLNPALSAGVNAYGQPLAPQQGYALPGQGQGQAQQPNVYQANPSQQPGQSFQPPAPPSPPQQPAQAPGGEGAMGPNPGVNPELVAAVGSSCLSCHDGRQQATGARPRLDLRNLDRLDYYQRSAMLTEAARQKMPKTGEKWQKDRLKLLEEYVDQARNVAQK